MTNGCRRIQISKLVVADAAAVLQVSPLLVKLLLREVLQIREALDLTRHLPFVVVEDGDASVVGVSCLREPELITLKQAQRGLLSLAFLV